MPESYSQYYTKNLLSFVATIQLIYILIFQKYSPFPAFVLPSNIGFQTHTRKNRPAVLTYIDSIIYVSSSPILHIGIWVGQKYRYSQYNFSFFQTNPVLSFLSADYPPFSKRKTAGRPAASTTSAFRGAFRKRISCAIAASVNK